MGHPAGRARRAARATAAAARVTLEDIPLPSWRFISRSCNRRLETSPDWIGLCVMPLRPITKLSSASEPVSDMRDDSSGSIDMLSGRRLGFLSGMVNAAGANWRRALTNGNEVCEV